MLNGLSLLLILPALWGSPFALRDGPAVLPNPPRVTFGREMFFSASVQTAGSVKAAELILQTDSLVSSEYPAEVSAPGGKDLTARRDLLSEPVFPFSTIVYWWSVALDTGETILSEKQSLQYGDDRFSWQSAERGRATVRWVAGDRPSAEDAADLLLLDLGTISADLDAPIPDAVGLYLYPRLADFQSGLGKLAYAWEGGVADPAAAIILLAAAPGAEGRQSLAALLPHETVHLLLGAKWKDAYPALPLWLVEGTADFYAADARSDADQALRQAAKNGSLIPIAALCRNFPSEEGPALLAYAESGSFVGYLRRIYGPAAVRSAMAEYAAGADCTRGFSAVTGKRVDALEKAWRAELSAEPAGPPAAWAVVLGAFGLLAAVLAAGWFVRRGRKLPRE